MATRKNRKSWRAAQLYILLNGVSSLRSIADDVSPASLRRVLKDFKERNHALADDLETYLVDELKVSVEDLAGRVAPSAGCSRSYLVQSIKAGPPWIRLPVNVLDAQKGDKVQVSFDQEKIVVTSA